MSETIYYGAIISALTILVNLFISIRTIHINKEIQKENAGKNRTIYGIQLENINKIVPDPDLNGVDKLNKILSTGDFSIITAYEIGNKIEGIVLGKIKP